MDIVTILENSLLLFFVVFAVREQTRVLEKVLLMIDEKNDRQERRVERLYAIITECLGKDDTKMTPK